MAAACALALVTAAACSSNSAPAQPSVSVGTPAPQQPANSAQIAYASQPVTLTVQNAAITSGTGATTYVFEVATDSAFGSKVQTKDNVAEGANGQTSVKLDTLANGGDYYWHSRATNGGVAGQFGAVYKFTLGSAVTLSAPVPLAPLTGAQTNPRPALRVTNSTHQGQAGPVSYKFEIARDAGFSSIVASGTNSEGTVETDFTPAADLPLGSLYWRATATDLANNVSSTPSTAHNFTVIAYSQAERVAVQLGVALWPGVQPPGAVGQAVMGDNWTIQTLHHLPTNTFFQSPTVEDLRIFDLLDRGFDPDGAIAWMNSHGYFTVAQWYPPPEKAVIGLPYTYIAARNKVTVNGTWDIVLKAE